mgnify:CR=1 FL=1
MNCQERAEASQTLMAPPRHSVLKSMLLQSECTRTYKNSIKLHEAIARNAVPILFSTNCQPSPITNQSSTPIPTASCQPPATNRPPQLPPQLPPPQLQTANSVFQPLSLQPSRLTPTPGVVQPLSLYCGKVFPPLECVLDPGSVHLRQNECPPTRPTPRPRPRPRPHPHPHPRRASAHFSIGLFSSLMPVSLPCPTASTPPNAPLPAYDVPGAGTVPPDALSPSPWVIQPASAPRSF